MERYPNLKEEVGGSIPNCEISSLLDKIFCQVVNYLMCFDTGLLAFGIKKKQKKDTIAMTSVEFESSLKVQSNLELEVAILYSVRLIHSWADVEVSFGWDSQKLEQFWICKRTSDLETWIANQIVRVWNHM